jgi:hypothetical protein
MSVAGPDNGFVILVVPGRRDSRRSRAQKKKYHRFVTCPGCILQGSHTGLVLFLFWESTVLQVETILALMGKQGHDVPLSSGRSCSENVRPGGRQDFIASTKIVY